MTLCTLLTLVRYPQLHAARIVVVSTHTEIGHALLPPVRLTWLKRNGAMSLGLKPGHISARLLGGVVGILEGQTRDESKMPNGISSPISRS